MTLKQAEAWIRAADRRIVDLEVELAMAKIEVQRLKDGHGILGGETGGTVIDLNYEHRPWKEDIKTFAETLAIAGGKGGLV